MCVCACVCDRQRQPDRNILFSSPSLLRHRNKVHLDALFDPEVAAHGLPVLRARDVEQAVVDAALHALVEHLDELVADVRLVAAQAAQERRLQLRGQFTAAQSLVPAESTFMIVNTAKHFPNPSASQD